MLNDEICKLRDKLNKSIEQGDDYEITYQLSIELDELITKYYEKQKVKKWINVVYIKVKFSDFGSFIFMPYISWFFYLNII